MSGGACSKASRAPPPSLRLHDLNGLARSVDRAGRAEIGRPRPLGLKHGVNLPECLVLGQATLGREGARNMSSNVDEQKAPGRGGVESFHEADAEARIGNEGQ